MPDTFTPDEADELNWQNVVTVRTNLATALADLITAHHQATAALSELVSPTVFDVEMEGDPEQLIRGLLANIYRDTRSADALLDQVRTDEIRSRR